MHQATRMISLLGRSSCSVFYAYPVEDGWWWLPLMNGEVPRGASASTERIRRRARSHVERNPRKAFQRPEATAGGCI